MHIRKTALHVETISSEHGRTLPAPVRRGYAAAVLVNPCGAADDLEAGAAAGALLGEMLTERLLAAMDRPAGAALAYGKAAIVGSDGSTEHASAVLHPALGAPVRRRIAQGRSIMPSTIKRGAVGARIDIPLHGADDEWDFDLLDALEACVMDAPLPGEMVVFIALAVGGRPGASAANSGLSPRGPA